MFAAEPDSLDIDILSQVPDLLLSIDSIVITVLISAAALVDLKRALNGNVTHAECIIPALLN